MSPRLTVETVEIERFIATACAIVKAQGPRGGPQEWAVDFDRRGNIKSAVRLAPSYGFYAPEGIPEEIAKAARSAWTA